MLRMADVILTPAFEDRVFSIIQSTSFKEFLNSNRIEDKKIIAEYYEKIEILHLAIEIYLSLNDYNSVKRLLEKKLDIMKVKSKLKEEVQNNEQNVEQLKKDLKNWETDIEDYIKREKRNKEIAIEKAKQHHENLKASMKEKEKVFDEQIKAVDEALKSIEEISKTSPNIQS